MDMVHRGDMMSVEDVIDILAIPLIGAVPDDEHIVIATNQGEPLAGDASDMPEQAYLNICKRILGESVPLMNLDVNSRNIWSQKLTKSASSGLKGGDCKMAFSGAVWPERELRRDAAKAAPEAIAGFRSGRLLAGTAGD